MPVISMAIARHHLRDPEDDDEYLEMLLDAAERKASDYLNRQFFADEEALGEAQSAGLAGAAPILINPAIRAACLLILGHLYANREDVVTGTIAAAIPMASLSLLTPHRIGWGI
ncbi:head-tail connector protein [Pseudomonas sp. S07E 245]|uniref:head-tail connector protein n=1 Tax=Pseudomonas sp. S07E 245 TaxID=2866278 RepID=UPI001C73C8D9|nr:head-tail connector protein [Pseudomonas sp. S07E 245]QYX54370.1 head-tail connector protein [Pseudomonas sp. S07E 245]